MASWQKVRRLPPLNSLRAFEMAARHLSFSVAAAELNVTQSAISRQIKGLEDFLGISLFRRLPRSLELTVQGREFAEPLHQAFDQLQRATETALTGHGPMTLTINVLPTFAMRWLIPRLTHFTAANPDVEVRMITSVLPVDFRVEDADVAIRVGPDLIDRNQDTSPFDLIKGDAPLDLTMSRDLSALRAMPFMPYALVPVCAPSLLKAGPPIKHPSDLKKHTLIHVASLVKGWRYWLKMMGIDDGGVGPDSPPRHLFMAIQEAIEGHGIALAPSVIVESELRTGSLVTLFGDRPVLFGVFYFLCRQNEWQSPKIQKFRDWLLTEATPPRAAREKKDELQPISSVAGPVLASKTGLAKIVF